MSTRDGKVEKRPVAATDKPALQRRRGAAPIQATLVPVQTFFADEIAVLAAGVRREAAPPLTCDACDAPVTGDATGLGLLVWARGDELRTEEPALCERCASTLGVVMNRKFEIEDDEEG